MNDIQYQKDIQFLTEAVIQTIKDISAKGEGISPTSLSSAFSQRIDIKELLSSPRSPSASQNKEEELLTENQELKKQIDGLNAALEKVSRQMIKDTKPTSQSDNRDTALIDFLKRTILIFMSMLRTPDNEAYFDTLDQFKKMLIQDVMLEEMDKALNKLQKIALWEEESFAKGGKVSRKQDYERLMEYNQELKVQSEKAISQRDKLEKTIVKLEEDFEHKENFYKRTLLLFISMLRTKDNKRYFAVLDRFKKLLNQKSSVDRMDKVIETLQNVSMLEEKTIQDDLPEDTTVTTLDRLKSLILSMTNELQMAVGGNNNKLFEEIEDQIHVIGNIDAIFTLKKDLLPLIRLCSKQSSDIIQSGDGTINTNSQSIETSVNPQPTIENSDAGLSAPRIERFKTKLAKIKKNIFSKRSKPDSTESPPETIFLSSGADGEKKDKNLIQFQEKLTDMKREITNMQSRTRFLENELLIDALTGVYNRRASEKKLSELIQKFQQHEKIFSLLIFDIDNFSAIVNTYGRSAGDQCLKYLAQRMKTYLRKSDFLARYGSDEFFMILPNTEDREATEAAHYLIELVSKMRFSIKNEHIFLSISIGITQVDPSDHDSETIINRVYKAIFSAKKNTQNKVICIKPSGIVTFSNKRNQIQRTK